VTLCAALIACGSGGGGASAANTAGPSSSPAQANGLSVPSGFSIETIANVPGARELAFAPSGDLFVGTPSSNVYIVLAPEGQSARAQIFANMNDSPAAGVAFSSQNSSLYVGTQFGVYRIPYTSGDRTAQSQPVKVASVRTGSPPPGSDGDVHRTTSVAINGNTVYAAVGSSCNACTEIDPTRATIQQMALDGSGMTTKATHIRNAIALAINPQTNTLWAGDAGQDDLPTGHPYEFFDGVTLHAGIANYGWTACEENHVAYTAGANCSNTVVPLVEFLAYETAIGAAFYPSNQTGAYAFPAQYRGGAFVALHGSWHQPNGCNVAPRVAFVPMHGDTPATAVNWNDPTAQWSDFVGGFQRGCGAGTRIGRPTGVAVGPQGDLFVADDQTGAIYRIRPR